jgi:amidase
MRRSGVLLIAVIAIAFSLACGTAVAPPDGAVTERSTFDLEEATVAELQRRMETGRDTARSLVEKYLSRIEAIDRHGPALRSVIEINPDALDTADALDAERKKSGARGALHGIPVLLKDNIATADRMLTTAGSLALASAPAPADAFLVRRLREAGAVLLGKTNLSEWANFRSTRSTSGWSARGGQTRNPYALDRSPSGSSSGSAVAVAASLAAAAVGTETDGSIVSPAHANGLVGIKPTVGLVSRGGIIPISATQDTAGPIARTVADAVALLGAIAGEDQADAATHAAAGRRLEDYSQFLDPDGLRGARIGVVRNTLFGYSPAADRLAEAALERMKQQGAIAIDPANIPTLGKFDAGEFDVLLYEFKAGLNAYLAALGPAAPVRSLKDLIAFNETKKDQEMKHFGQEIFLMAESKGPLTSDDYRRALASNRRMAGPDGIDAVMDRHDLDALVAPTFAPAWMVDLVNGDSFPSGAASPSSIAAVAGYPHITVPMGYYRGVPVGLSFFGTAWSEPTLIKIAYAYEQATKHRRPPTFAPTADLDDVK